MAYVYSFVLPVPTDRLDQYLRLAKTFGEGVKKAGAISYFEARADDAADGPHSSFRGALKAKEGEVVILGVALWKDKAAAEKGMTEALDNEAFKALMPGDMPFDMERMYWDYFQPVLEL